MADSKKKFESNTAEKFMQRQRKLAKQRALDIPSGSPVELFTGRSRVSMSYTLLSANSIP